jgi:hypothetical protein
MQKDLGYHFDGLWTMTVDTQGVIGELVKSECFLTWRFLSG